MKEKTIELVFHGTSRFVYGPDTSGFSARPAGVHWDNGEFVA